MSSSEKSVDLDKSDTFCKCKECQCSHVIGKSELLCYYCVSNDHYPIKRLRYLEEKHTVKIFISDGVVEEVFGLPSNYDYEILDENDMEEEDRREEWYTMLESARLEEEKREK